uniref:Histone H1 subtype 6 n=1 Tax=Vicia unijuga TaxID=153962 RepID=L7V0B9_9FABA|nr:histone H1 subtype 6 [Vicia unijuga]
MATKTSKPLTSHPTYEEMIKEAIVGLKERTGSSQYAIAKFIEEKHKQLPPTFKKLLLQNLKKNVASGKLVKVKGSFKLSTATKPAPATKKPALAKPKTKPVAKVTAAKAKPAVKPKAKAVVQPKVASKPKAVAAKPEAAVAKPKAAAAKPKAVVKAKAGVKPKTKAARTSTRTTPGKKVAIAKAVVKKAVAAKKAPVKSVKTPVKKVTTKRGGRK